MRDDHLSDGIGRPDQRPGGPTARRIILGSQLRRLREQANITRGEAGYAIRGSESKISRLELGRVGFKERDVEDLLTMYGVSDPDERAQILALVAQSNERGWWHRYTDLMPNWFHDYVGLEESASRLQTYELQFVPGLLQTEEYIRAVASHGRPARGGEEIDRRVGLRMQRQKLLHRPGAPRLWAVIDESVLHRPIGGRRVLREQIQHLLEITRQPNITLQVVPYELSGYSAEGAFTVLRFAEPELPDVVYIEHLAGALYLDRLDEIEKYGRVFDRLTVDAETPDRTRQFLAKHLAEL
ncbi:MAG TPA: helix-turn-helix transcriptional regulator [Actinophytocola sp.]|uniref:helix-turn-helix domain-containing protein n=1 Tax=Actinophytocola sp. TaxID=1872138 RepID=UPI002DDDA8E3|nr:helix-turn-helix transcriptional regulator [Actinophytocola sp.]HEV2783280.1 helix-turn-helix transcriptional regulator [Actinophytocola sp.]